MSTRSAPDRSGPGRPPPTSVRDLGAPIFVLNLKVYPGALGDAAARIAALLEEAGRSRGVAVAIAPALPDLGRVAHEARLPVLAQHVDPGEGGTRTGFVSAEAVRSAGGRGSLVNHSEHPLAPDQVAAAVGQLRSLDLASVVCAPDAASARRLAAVSPSYLAVEPPELIAGTQAVSTARPGLVSETVEAVRGVAPDTRVLCGAGVRTRKDVARALELGTVGVLVASAVAAAKDPKAAIDELLSGF